MNVQSRDSCFAGANLALPDFTDIHKKKSVASLATLQSRIIIEEILIASLNLQRKYYATGKRTP
jgi:hypothetical protein